MATVTTQLTREFLDMILSRTEGMEPVTKFYRVFGAKHQPYRGWLFPEGTVKVENRYDPYPTAPIEAIAMWNDGGQGSWNLEQYHPLRIGPGGLYTYTNPPQKKDLLYRVHGRAVHNYVTDEHRNWATQVQQAYEKRFDGLLKDAEVYEFDRVVYLVPQGYDGKTARWSFDSIRR